MLALTTPREANARLAVGVAGFAGLGVLVSVAIDETWQPSLDWAKLLVCTAVGIGAGLLIRVLSGRRGLQSRRLANAALLGGALGWLIGAWGGAEFEGGTLGEALIATVIPLALIGLRIGLTAVPAATERREIEQRSRSWIFVTPALAFVMGGLLVPLVRTIYISFKGRDSSEFVGADNYKALIDDPNFFDVSDWPDIFTSRLFLGGMAVVVSASPSDSSAGEPPARVRVRTAVVLPMIAGFFLAACAVLSVLRGTIVQQHLVGDRRHRAGDGDRPGGRRAVRQGKGENLAKSLIFLPMAISFVGAGDHLAVHVPGPRRPRPADRRAQRHLGRARPAEQLGLAKWLVAAVLAAIIRASSSTLCKR